jgi:hypothetical protein
MFRQQRHKKNKRATHMTHPQYADNLEEKDQNPLWWVFRLGSSNRFRPGKGTLKERRFTALTTSDSPPPKEQKKDRLAQRRARPRTGNSFRRPLSQQEIQTLKARFAHIGAGRVYMNGQGHVFIIDGNGAHDVEPRMNSPLRERAFSTVAGLESVQGNLREKAASYRESFRRARMDKTTVTPRTPKPEKPINPLPCTLVLADGINVDPEDMGPYAQGGAVKIQKPSNDDILKHYKSALEKVLQNPTTRVLVVISGRSLMNEIKASLENHPKIKERISFALVKKDTGQKDLETILRRHHRALTNLINSDNRLHLSFRNPLRDNPEASAKRKTSPREKPHSDTNGYNRTAVYARHGGMAPGTV